MKNFLQFESFPASLFGLLLFNLFFINSCKQEVVPVVITYDVSSITKNSASCGGLIVDEGTSGVISKGVAWSTKSDPTLSDYTTNEGTGPGDFLSTISGLEASETYHVRAYASNKEGTGYGMSISFKTLPLEVPKLVIDSIESITDKTARCSFRILSDGGSVVLNSGLIWSKDTSELIFSDGYIVKDAQFNVEGFTRVSKIYKSTAVKLTSDTEYYMRVFAYNKAGIGYSKILKFRTLTKLNPEINFNPEITYGNITDQDGNTYKTVIIGNQEWMAENLKAVTYNDGSTVYQSGVDYFVNPIPMDFVWYNRDISFKAEYGALYSWFAVKKAGLCPTGWHVPSVDEWYEMIHTLDTSAINPLNPPYGDIFSYLAGGMLKESGQRHWADPNSWASNSTGFTALPSGTAYAQYPDYKFELLGSGSLMWTTYELVIQSHGQTVGFNVHLKVGLDYNSGSVFKRYGDNFGSVRCVRSFR